MYLLVREIEALLLKEKREKNKVCICTMQELTLVWY